MPPSIDYDSLTPAQRRAVCADKAPQMIVAGPGTGKTRVLVCRAAHVIVDAIEPVAPSQVVLITFTTKAAAQLKDRLEPMIGSAVQGVRAGTIHHFAFELVKTHHKALGIPNDFIVIDQAVMEAFWQRWCEQEGVQNNYREVMTSISRFKLGLEAIKPWQIRGARAYQAALEERNALDYDDILTSARDLLRDHRDVRKHVQERIGALLVDEFQDTDPVQYALIKMAMDPLRQGLFCVADDDQSIYSFRGARPKNVRTFIKEFDCTRENGKLHILDLNFRSNECIFRSAESVLDAADRIKRAGEVQVERDRGEGIEIAPQETGKDEYAFILKQVKQWIQETGVPPSDVAVFMPWNRQNLDLEQLMLRAGIPCEVSGIQRLMETPVVRRLVTLLQFLHKQIQGQPVDLELDDFLKEVLTPDTYAKLSADVNRRNQPLYHVLHGIMRSDSMPPGWSPADRVQLEGLYALIANLVAAGHQPQITVRALIDKALDHLSAPLQLLAEQRDKLVDPITMASFKPAIARLKVWIDHHRNTQTVQAHLQARLLIHHTNPLIARIWHEMVRGMLHEADILQDYVLYGTRQDHPYHVVTHAYLSTDNGNPLPPWTERDLLLTNDVRQGLAKAMTLCGGQPSRGVTVIHVGLEHEREPTFTIEQEKGLIGDLYRVDEEGRFESPSVRLFKLMQGALDVPPAPLFEEYVMVDLETTSTDTKHCRVVQIGGLKVKQGAIVDRFDQLVALPPDLTDDEATVLREVCGFELTEFEEAKEEAAVWQSFCRFVDGLPMVAYNGLHFDFQILNRLKRRYPDVKEAWTMMYDMLPDAHALFPDERSYSAENLRRSLLKDETPTAHKALEDCEAQQTLLNHFQRVRAQRQRILGFEPFLTAVTLAMLREPETRLRDAKGEETLLFKVGYMWALKGNHLLLRMLRTVIPGNREVVEIIRHNQKLASYIQEAPFEFRKQTYLNLDERIAALVEPFASLSVKREAGLRELLSHMALWGAEATDHGQHLVTLSTYHSAKGLEFSHVICGFVCDGAFPDFRDKTDDDRRERRRLLYVGMTRAKQKLILSYPKQSNGFDKSPSPFLRDIPQEYILEVTLA